MSNFYPRSTLCLPLWPSALLASSALSGSGTGLFLILSRVGVFVGAPARLAPRRYTFKIRARLHSLNSYSRGLHPYNYNSTVVLIVCTDHS